MVLFTTLSGYVYKYQQLVYEGSVLADERCLTLDSVIARKQEKAVEYYQTIATITDPGEMKAASDSLIPYFAETIEVSDRWLEKQKAFIDRWDFKFFTHGALEKAFYAQYDKYIADYESNQLMIEYIQNLPDKSLEQDLINSIKKQSEKQTILDESIKEAEQRSDFRYRFIQVPESKCSESPFKNPSDSRESLAMNS